MDIIVGALLTLLAIVFVLALLVVALYSLYIVYIRSKYSHIPCPQPVSFFLGHGTYLKEMSAKHGNFEVTLCEWAEKYGDTFLLMLLHHVFVVTCNPDNVKELLVTGEFPKSKRYNQVANVLGQRVFGKGLATETDHAAWAPRRTGLNPAFHRTVLKELMTEFNTTCDELVRVLGSHADKKDNIQILPYLNKATLDVIGKVAFGKDLGSFQQEQGPFGKAILDMTFLFNESVRDPLLALPFFGREYKARMKEVVTFLRQTGQEWLDERRGQLDRGEYVPDDILTNIIKVKDTPDEIMLDDIVTVFIAGQETTANTTSFMLMEIGRHPEILQKLYDEIDEVVGKKSHVTFEDVSKMEYMTMVWKETLRMYAVAPVTFRDVDRVGYKIDGYEIPKDTIVMMSSYISSRNPKLVKDPLTFKPERFAPNSEDKPNTYGYFPFALGPRSCIGQTFAQMEGKVLLTKFLQNFDLDLDPNQSFDIQEAVTLKPKDGVRATLSWRKT